jgi:Subtilase family/PKD-like domain/Secretion system C-terminal sorting domain
MNKRTSPLIYGLLSLGIFFFFSLLVIPGRGQTLDDISFIQKSTHVESLQKYALELNSQALAKKTQAEEMAKKKGWVIKKTFEDGRTIELKELGPKGRPVYFSTCNLNAAKTVSTNKVWTGGGLGFNLSGSGITLREWDESAVRPTHQELTGRVVQGDGASGYSGHSTHVAGTMLATGIDPNAHGMANLANLRAFDWNSDYAEMASEAANGALLSNHSYIFITGWYNSASSWYWYGDTTVSRYEDYEFGFYCEDAKIVDSIAFSAPYYLVCRAAGNDRGEGPSTQPVTHYVWDGTNWVSSSTVRNLDGMPSGYDCIAYSFGTGKNMMTVGAVYPIPNGYTSPADVVIASFSGTGPTDDGRIKPDIVADGVGLYSTYSTADNAYATMSGTSMATPNATGSLGLLQQHYHNLFGIYMRSATLKGLVIHTADEAGNYPGPDYKFGWGLLNTAKAATLLSNTTTAKVKELTLANGTTYTLNIKANGTEPLRATICWTDPPGTTPAPSLNPSTIMLVNDLDLHIDGQTYKPWILDPANPSAGATTGDNIRDNVEQIYIPSLSAGCHTLTVTHKGTLVGGSQAFALIVSGITVYPDFIAGTIGGNQSICYSSTPALLTGTAPTGGNPSYTYQWQNSTDSINFTNIPGATVLNYQPGPLTVKTFFRQIQSASGSCDNANTNIIRIHINPLPIPTITGTSNLCIGTSGVSYSTESNMSAYTWAVSSGGTITSGGNMVGIEVTWNTAGPQTVSVNYTNGNGCTAASPFVYNVTVNTLPIPTITGPTMVCATSTGNVYTTEAGMSGYIWTVSAGSTVTAGGTATSNTVTVTWNTAGAQTVSVNYTNGNGCTAASPVVYNVTVNALPVPTISGPTPVCITSTGNVYTTEAGMSGYIWTVSAGSTVTAGGTATSNTVTVTWNTAGAQTVSVNYINGNGCTATAPVVYNITLNTLPVPMITGPTLVCATSTGNVYTTEADMSGYIWAVSPGGTVTAGGTTTSNTVTVSWNTVGAQTVSVNYINGNGCTATAPVVYNVTVNALPVPTISGPTPVCATSTGNVYTTEAGMSNYIWSVSAGGTITAGGTTTSNTVTIDWPTAGAQSISVNYTNGSGCTAAAPVLYPVTVNPLPVPSLSGNGNLCAGTTGIVYTTETGMSNYAWFVSAGGTITAGGTSTSFTVTVTWNSAGNQSVGVNYQNSFGCWAISPTGLPVTVNALPVPTITGPSTICAVSTGNVYTTESGMTNYIWNISAGGTITAGGTPTDNTVTIDWNTSGAQTVSVSYTNINGCIAASPVVYNVTVNALPVPTISGPTPVCATSTGEVYSTQVGMSSYIWAVSAGGTVTAGGTSTNNTVTVTWNTAGAQTVSVNYTNGNGCTAATPTFYPVTVNPLPDAAGTISGPPTVIQGQTGVVFSVTTITNATGYTWSLPAGATITSGANTSSITVSFSASAVSGIITVTGTNACGNGTVSPDFNLTVTVSVPVDLEVTGTVTGTVCYNGTNIITVALSAPFTVQSGGNAEMIAGVAILYKPGTTVQSGGYMWGHIAPQGPWCMAPAIVTVPTGIEVVSKQSFFKVYPNPTTGSFTLELSEVSETSIVKVEIYGMRGEKLLNDQFTGEKTHEFSLESNPIGIYFIRVISGDNLGSQKIIKQ